MRVERGQHAVDGILHQRLLVDRLDIVATDALQHVAEQIELLVELALVAASGLGIALVLGQHGSERQTGTESQDRGKGGEAQTGHWGCLLQSVAGRISTGGTGVYYVG